jgi:hypothetical protein
MSSTWPRFRLLAVTGGAGVLVASLAAAAPQARAATTIATTLAGSRPTVCQTTSQDSDHSVTGNPGEIAFSGTGTLTCLDEATGQTLQGTDTFGGTVTGLPCTGDDTLDSYHARVDWSDGTVTTGTFTNFDIARINGSEIITIIGPVDASSTRFAGYSNYVIGVSTGSCNASGGAGSGKQTGVVTYLPPSQ